MGSNQYLERLPSREIGLKTGDSNNNNNNNRSGVDMCDFAQANPNNTKDGNNGDQEMANTISMVAQRSIDSLHT